VDQAFDDDGLYALRAALAAHAGDMDLTRSQLERLIIVAGELASNAVRHGGGSGRLRLWRDGPLLHCAVSDHGPGLRETTAGTVRPDPAAGNGRGMWICRQLSDAVVVSEGQAGSTVTATIRLDDTEDV
jgi:anti-sigma regulatory factor (Ser/Thr protein kinase)